jgi:hypothetical protein
LHVDRWAERRREGVLQLLLLLLLLVLMVLLLLLLNSGGSGGGLSVVELEGRNHGSSSGPRVTQGSCCG